MNRNVKKLIQAATMLAILVLLQLVTKPLGQFVTGFCADFMIAVTTLSVGFSSGLFLALVFPYIAYLIGIGPKILLIAPSICVANMIFMMILYIFISRKKDVVKWATRMAGVLVAGTAKFAVLNMGVTNLVIPELDMTEAKIQETVSFFSWPQLVTAVVGALFAALVYPRLRKALGNEPVKDKIYVREKPINPDEIAEYEPADEYEYEENEENTEEADSDEDENTDA